jgi:orotidine-5'-phosphate decarboxylase
VVKVGLELFSAAGPIVVQEMINDGYRVFLDLKLADIPTTVERTARVLGALGVSYLTMHAFAGTPVLRAGVEGLADGAARAGLEPPCALAVTILTSDADAPPHILAGDVREAKSLAPSLMTVVPGIRPLGVPSDDQSRAATPAEAIAAGADLLVVGRAVTGAADREAAAISLAAELGG